MEVMKQVYDIGSIFDRLDSLKGVKENLSKVAERELEYRGFKPNEFKVIIDDILNSSHNFCIQGKIKPMVLKTLLMGTNKLNNFIYGDKFRKLQAQIAVAKAVYITSLFEQNCIAIKKYDSEIDMSKWKIAEGEYHRLNRLKKNNLEAFYYWNRTLYDK